MGSIWKCCVMPAHHGLGILTSHFWPLFSSLFVLSSFCVLYSLCFIPFFFSFFLFWFFPVSSFLPFSSPNGCPELNTSFPLIRSSADAKDLQRVSYVYIAYSVLNGKSYVRYISCEYSDFVLKDILSKFN